MTKKIYHETFEKCPESICFPLLNFALTWQKMILGKWNFLL